MDDPGGIVSRSGVRYVADTRGAFAQRLETLIGAILAQPGTRLPGARRLALRAASARDGLEIPASLYDELKALSATA